MTLQIGEIHVALNSREENHRMNVEWYMAIGEDAESIYCEGRLDEVRFIQKLLRELA